MKKVFFILVVIFSGIVAHAQQAPVPSPDSSLAEYAGKYKFPDGSVVTEITVVFENGVLSASSSAGSSELKKVAVDTFEVVAYGGTANFRRNSEKKITGVQVLINEMDLEGTKEEDALTGLLPDNFLVYKN
ncbi:MAG: DUF3471 domain-containing protein [Bacteroidetes bacterium]|nr:DUF3471 domain-containing protein [Bacteroidota bacterium]